MSYLAINRFDDSFTTITLNQKINVACNIDKIRFRMIKHGTIADGTLTLQVFDGPTSLGTSTITAAEFNSVEATYAYGMFTFDFDSLVVNLESGTKELSLVLTMSGHTEDPNNYVGLIREHENPIYEEYEDTHTRPSSVSPEEDCWYNSFGVEFWGQIRA